MNKIAIMQPYFYPYIEYFRLINQVNTFVFLTDVQYTRGWINRNRIKSNINDWQYITVPIKKHSRSSKIKDILISDKSWNLSLIKKLKYSYKKTSMIDHISNFILNNNSDLLFKININSIKEICNILEIKTCFIDSSDLNLKSIGKDRILDICNILGASDYINPIGGISLYNSKDFQDKGINLEFIKPNINYNNKLSILDMLLNENCNNILFKEWKNEKSCQQI